MFSLEPYTNLLLFPIYVVIAVLIYYLLKWINGFHWSSIFSEQMHRWISKITHIIMLVYEPVVSVLLLISLIGIRPRVLLPLAVLIVAFTFPYIRSYFARILIMLSEPIEKSSFVHVKDYKGQVADVGRFALKLESKSGAHHIPYHLLLKHGYTQSDHNEIGRLLEVTLTAAEAKQHSSHEIQDILASIPYLDWKMDPDIIMSDNDIRIKMLLRDSSFKDEVLAVLKQHGLS